MSSELASLRREVRALQTEVSILRERLDKLEERDNEEYEVVSAAASAKELGTPQRSGPSASASPELALAVDPLPREESRPGGRRVS